MPWASRPHARVPYIVRLWAGSGAAGLVSPGLTSIVRRMWLADVGQVCSAPLAWHSTAWPGPALTFFVGFSSSQICVACVKTSWQDSGSCVAYWKKTRCHSVVCSPRACFQKPKTAFSEPHKLRQLTFFTKSHRSSDGNCLDNGGQRVSVLRPGSRLLRDGDRTLTGHSPASLVPGAAKRMSHSTQGFRDK